MVTRTDASGDVLASARRATKKANAAALQVEMEFVKFRTGDRSITFNIDITGETVWATPRADPRRGSSPTSQSWPALRPACARQGLA
jgi:hypothetical protein